MALPFVIVGPPMVYERVVEGKERKIWPRPEGGVGAGALAVQDGGMAEGHKGWGEGLDGAVKGVDAV